MVRKVVFGSKKENHKRLTLNRFRGYVATQIPWPSTDWYGDDSPMRPVALGRKNWLHIGSPQAGSKVAAILSVVESCRRLQVAVRDYFSKPA